MKTGEHLNIQLAMCNAHYQELAELMQNLAKQIDSEHPMVIREHLNILEEKQAEASRLDALLEFRIEDEGLQGHSEGAISERKRLLEHIAELNSLLVAKLEGKIAVMNHELDVNRQSHRAMTGYRMPRNSSGSMLHKST